MFVLLFADLAAIDKADPRRGVASRSIFPRTVCVYFLNAVTAVEIHMLACFGKDRFGFDGELALFVLQVEERRSGREAVFDFDIYRRYAVFRQH